LALLWPVAPEAALLSDKDRQAPPLDPADRWFTYP
jgi:dTDP-4-dehydrorhamnose 3,5-epimerase